ncbi:hypothetical protein [Aquimarina agarivorans]|uniref:hypothetical protein n=1 Tax=Aquimarina agarivorans TaxID=980584 RepID=UPI000248FAF2|nr:hypothetical protein [Aquimarina agarivorans]
MEKSTTAILIESVKLVDGTFTSAQANDVVRDLIDTKINFHKLSRLSLTEGDHNHKAHYDNNRLDELLEEKERLLSIIKHAKRTRQKNQAHEFNKY